MALGAICFNTQPPEGGWTNKAAWMTSLPLFQHTAARRRLAIRLATTIRHIRFQHTAARRRLDSKMGGSDGNGKFQHTAARRRLAGWTSTANISKPFQHTAARRRLAHDVDDLQCVFRVSTHSRPKAAGRYAAAKVQTPSVSTHSRPKAAGITTEQASPDKSGFNTQPPEGGWAVGFAPRLHTGMFQHTAARRRLESIVLYCIKDLRFQHTAARRRLATDLITHVAPYAVSTHSRPKAAGEVAGCGSGHESVSTHSRPKAAGQSFPMFATWAKVSTHSRPKAAG